MGCCSNFPVSSSSHFSMALIYSLSSGILLPHHLPAITGVVSSPGILLFTSVWPVHYHLPGNCSSLPRWVPLCRRIFHPLLTVLHVPMPSGLLFTIYCEDTWIEDSDESKRLLVPVRTLSSKPRWTMQSPDTLSVMVHLYLCLILCVCCKLPLLPVGLGISYLFSRFCVNWFKNLERRHHY